MKPLKKIINLAHLSSYKALDDVHRKEKSVVVKTTTLNAIRNTFPQTVTERDDMTQDLMRRIGSSIEEWAAAYHLENLPKDIIFQHALAALNSMNNLFAKK